MGGSGRGGGLLVALGLLTSSGFRGVDAQQEGAAITSLGEYPGNDSENAGIRGRVSCTDELEEGVSMTATLTGLEADATGGIHVHEGRSCDEAGDVGGHYMGAGNDQWESIMWTSNGAGAAEIDLFVPTFGLSGDDNNNGIGGRAVVVHNSEGDRVACAVLSQLGSEEDNDVSASMAPYPGEEDAGIRGTVTFEAVSGRGVRVDGLLQGLEENEVGAVRVHAGTSCTDRELIGNVYTPNDADEDPWRAATWASNFRGEAALGWFVPYFTAYEENALEGRALIVMDSKGARRACGILNYNRENLAADLGEYPAAPADQVGVRGTVAFEESSRVGVIMTGTVTGLESNATGVINVHQGTTCADMDEVGEYFTPDTGTIPPMVWDSDETGEALIRFFVPFFTLTGDNALAGRALVLQNEDGEGVACGLLSSSRGSQVVSLGSFPGQTKNTGVQGSVAFDDVDQPGVILEAYITGLEEDATGGIHVHEGFSCADANGIGGHFTTSQIGYSPWDTVTWTSDEVGEASVIVFVPFLSLTRYNPIIKRVVVVHNSASTPVACGKLAYQPPPSSVQDEEDENPTVSPTPSPSEESSSDPSPSDSSEGETDPCDTDCDAALDDSSTDDLFPLTAAEARAKFDRLGVKMVCDSGCREASDGYGRGHYCGVYGTEEVCNVCFTTDGAIRYLASDRGRDLSCGTVLMCDGHACSSRAVADQIAATPDSVSEAIEQTDEDREALALRPGGDGDSSPTEPASGGTNNAVIGAGVGIIGVAVLAMVGVGVVWNRRRRARLQRTDDTRAFPGGDALDFTIPDSEFM